MRLYALMLFLHLIAVVIWVGGMFLMHFAVRPSAAELLEPPQRLPLLATIVRRFFNWVTISVLVVLGTGVAMIATASGFRSAHPSVHAMFAVGFVMSAIYVYVRLIPFRRLQAAVAARDWPAGARAIGTVRVLVAINLALGVATVAIATLGRVL